jgi:hypothetical protein
MRDVATMWSTEPIATLISASARFLIVLFTPKTSVGNWIIIATDCSLLMSPRTPNDAPKLMLFGTVIHAKNVVAFVYVSRYVM